jgi:hypothetical protein
VAFWIQEHKNIGKLNKRLFKFLIFSPYRLPTDSQKTGRQRQSYPAAHQQNNNNVVWNKQKLDEQTTTFSTAKNEPPRRDWRREEVE